MTSQGIQGAILFAWLGACLVHDLRSRQVPTLLTVIPLIVAAAWRLYLGGWQLILLTVVLTLVSDLRQIQWRIPVGCCVTIIVLSLAGAPVIIYA
jgi:hypothetical protein